MNLRTTPLVMLTILATLACGRVDAASDRAGDGRTAVEPAALYWQGHAALGSGDWRLALQRFTDLERRLRRSTPSVADAPIYWQAYALMRAGRLEHATATVQRLTAEFPRSRWNDDAARLLRGRGGMAGTGTPAAGGAGASLETLMSQPPAQAIPGLVALLQGPHPVQIKKRALFVLGQIDDPGAVAQVVAAARGPDPALRTEAVRLLGVIGAKDEFREVYAAARDSARKREVLNAMGVAGADEVLADVARRDADPGLRRSALQALGTANGIDALVGVARSNTDLATRQAAIEALGVAGGDRALLELYPSVLAMPVLRDAVLKSLLVARDEHVVFDLYRRAKSPAEQQAVLRVLTAAGHHPDHARARPSRSSNK
ncbi:MAG: hypothetical protein AVDCRST_MAG71-788 [uncultured Lysobacter sp.]|uniref:FOG: HEAT repeat n=1 Tax=uncultured Lysobacter sp. TaxID=271060 RepID=A0A6J4KRS9_9GAMM|nr:MAG: hypothetical protein AVDCRST_MAG71-788 [uncultured Lysobacter sp.]